MDIKWYGEGCFRIKERNTIVYSDPTPLGAAAGRSRLKADIVTFSSRTVDEKALSALSADPYVITRPGEYEVNGVFVTAIAATNAKSTNTVMLYHFEDITVCYLGALDHILAQEEVEQLGEVDVLLVPAGGHGGINASQAAEVISLIEPLIIIPTHFDAQSPETLERFLKEMGSSAITPLDELRVSKSSLPEESQVVVLNPA